MDFEGYRIYSRRKTSIGENEYSLLAQYDIENGIGYDTGLDKVLIWDDRGSPSYVIIDGDTMTYRFINEGIQSGWPENYEYAVTSFDHGDPETGLESLESSILENRTLVIAGTLPDKLDELEVKVFPNPYYGRALWDGFSERERLIWFTNLPSRATIRIYTLSGEVVDVIEHNSATYRGEDLERLKSISGGKVQLSGGIHGWDLISQYDQAVASGLYLFTVENHNTGKIKQGKFLIIK
ncbi:MAG: hypothetical protein ACE5QV_04830, partial [Fidelibacterota bacterium]